MKHIKPCPFCGMLPYYEGYPDVRIECLQCKQAKVTAAMYSGDLGTMEASWNKRQVDEKIMISKIEDEFEKVALTPWGRSGEYMDGLNIAVQMQKRSSSMEHLQDLINDYDRQQDSVEFPQSFRFKTLVTTKIKFKRQDDLFTVTPGEWEYRPKDRVFLRRLR